MPQNYTNLIAAWNSSIQPPTGVTGTGLSSAMTTTQKLTAVNGWTLTGVIPTNFTVVGSQIANCINWTEFSALTASQQSNVLSLCAIPGGLLGGSTNIALLVDGMILASFPASGATIANLTALAKAAIIPWVTAPSGGGLASPIGPPDLIAAGGLT